MWSGRDRVAQGGGWRTAPRESPNWLPRDTAKLPSKQDNSDDKAFQGGESSRRSFLGQRLDHGRMAWQILKMVLSHSKPTSLGPSGMGLAHPSPPSPQTRPHPTPPLLRSALSSRAHVEVGAAPLKISVKIVMHTITDQLPGAATELSCTYELCA